MGYASYADYLWSTRWAERKKTYHADGGALKCFVCTSSKRLHIHHRTYRNLGNEKHDDLVTLCADCHHGVHEYIKSHDGYVPLDEAHIRFKQSVEAKLSPGYRPTKPPLTKKKTKHKKRQEQNQQRRHKVLTQGQKRATAKRKRAIKARQECRAEHELAEKRRKRQEAIRKAREDLGRPLTRREVAKILRKT